MKRVHFMGIGGTGMVALAGLFSEKGWRVRGSDERVYPPASDELTRMGVEVREGYSPKNLDPAPDLVVVGNVITRKNPEAQALLTSGIPYTSMAQALEEHFLRGRRSVIVTGTHGKTTTTSLLAWVLEAAGKSPGLFVGGIPGNFGKGYVLGTGDPFVVEGDEYDTAFFEKTPKFLHYAPRDLILTSVEFDHADIYRDFEHVREQFERLISILPKDGTLVANADSDVVRDLASRHTAERVRYYGLSERALWRATDIKVIETGTRFSVSKDGKVVASIDSPLLGAHNVANTVAVVAMAESLGVEPFKASGAVEKFRGVLRRQEFVGEAKGIRIYDDFAHHPTAIAETLNAFRFLAKARKGKLWAIFEPRSNTVRRRVFQSVLPKSFSAADEVILAPVYKKADSLTDRELLSPEEVVEAICLDGRKARAAKTLDQIVEIVTREIRGGDVVVFMSNGSFGGIPRRTLGAIA